MMRRNRLPETISIFAVGIAVGATLGVLFAPKSGRDTQEFLSEGARDQFDSAVARGKAWAKTAKRTVGSVKDHLMDATDAGERAFDEASRS
jgi:gas vesicle protein